MRDILLDRRRTACLLGAVLCVSGAHAAQPQLGGPMKHLLVTLEGGAINVDFESGNPSEVLELQVYEEEYDAPADVLNDRAYNGQFGWLAGGFISLPPGAGIWVEALAQTDGLTSYEQGTYAPMFTTEGSPSRWPWTGAMTHNWYAADAPGDYEATYTVYVGDAAGEPDPSFQAGFVTIMWMIPEPPCVADINGDGVVDTADLGLLIGEFGGAGPIADLNSDGGVDTADLGLLIGEFGSTCTAE